MSSLTNYNLTNRLFVALIHLWAQDFRLTDIFKSQFVAFEIAWNYITGLSRPWWLRKLLHFWGQLRQHSRTETFGIEQNWSQKFFILEVLIEHYWYNLSILPCPVSKRLISTRCKPTIMFFTRPLRNSYIHFIYQILPKLHFWNFDFLVLSSIPGFFSKFNMHANFQKNWLANFVENSKWWKMILIWPV